MKLSTLSPLEFFPVLQRWKQEAVGACAADIAQSYARSLASTFAESVVLARVYITQPFASATKVQQTFAQKIGLDTNEVITPSTNVLCLAGTAGREAGWNDRSQSHGHLAIPLSSTAFVSKLPMVSALFGQLGFLQSLFQSHDGPTPSKSRGMFFVNDATVATDDQQRLIIPARDFVEKHAVRTVFGGGERVSETSLVCFLVFTDELLSQRLVDSFSALSHLVAGSMLRLMSKKSAFPDGES